MPRWKCGRKPKSCKDSELNQRKEVSNLLCRLQEVMVRLLRLWRLPFRPSLRNPAISLLSCNFSFQFLFRQYVLIKHLLIFIRKPNGPSKALKLGGRLKDAEIFVDQLKSEGENVNSFQTPSSVVQGGSVSSSKLPPSTIATEP